MRIRPSFSRQVFLAVAVAILVPALFVSGTYGRHLLTLTLIYCTLGVSLNLVMGYAGLVSVAHGAFFGIGAYTTALMTVNGYGFTLSVIAGMALAAATGTLVGLVTLRLRGHYFALATLAFTMTVVTILERWDEVTRGSRGISDIPRPASFEVGGFDVVFKQFWPMYLLVLAVLCLALIITHRLVHSPFGRALQCVQRNELLGRVFGVNVVSAKLQALALSAALASASGSLYASYIAWVDPGRRRALLSFGALRAGRTALAAPSRAVGSMTHIMEVRSLTKRFGGLVAVDDVDFDIRRSTIFSIIGPNGAGKSTLFDLLTRVQDADAGQVVTDAGDLLSLPTHAVVHQGIARTFQHAQLIETASVRDNVTIGYLRFRPAGLLASLFRQGRYRSGQRLEDEQVQRVLQLMNLDAVQDQLVSTSSTLVRQLTSVAMAMASEPTMLLLDEPMGGLVESEVQILMDSLRTINRTGVTIVLIEHRMPAVMALSDHVLVLNFGRRIALGTPDEIQRNPHVIEAYLGSRHAD